MNGTYKWKRWLYSCMSLLAIGWMGCGPVLSTAVRQQVDPSVSFAALQVNPEAYQGRMIILGGAIVNCWNEEDTSYLEVSQHPLGYFDRPAAGKASSGRFLLRCDAHLAPEVYQKGRLITAAGRVIGVSRGIIGHTVTSYPILACQEHHLWSRFAAAQEYYDPGPWKYQPLLIFPGDQDELWYW